VEVGTVGKGVKVSVEVGVAEANKPPSEKFPSPLIHNTNNKIPKPKIIAAIAHITYGSTLRFF
jgi:hypothetical protein